MSRELLVAINSDRCVGEQLRAQGRFWRQQRNTRSRRSFFMLASIHHTVTWRYPAKKQKLHCSKPLHLHGACHLRPSKWSVPSLTSTVLSPHKASFSLFQRANNLFTSKHSKPGTCPQTSAVATTFMHTSRINSS